MHLYRVSKNAFGCGLALYSKRLPSLILTMLTFLGDEKSDRRTLPSLGAICETYLRKVL